MPMSKKEAKELADAIAGRLTVRQKLLAALPAIVTVIPAVIAAIYILVFKKKV